jgi:hypothetical protein
MGSDRQTTSESGRCFQLGSVLFLGLLASGFHSKKYVLYINSYSSTLQQSEGVGRGG